MISQGSLGNLYFVNALRILAVHPKYVKRLIVSDKLAASHGIYTVKFYKNGKWRYVHVDDKIPCRPSGRANFCRNLNPNETFAMIIEKAYAKLHGCYEALTYGLFEKVMQDLTPMAAVHAYRLWKLKQYTLCDDMWEILSAALDKKRVVGCGRFLEDPTTENTSARKGIAVGVMYEVVDVMVSSSEPTEELDALTIGMVCVRILQVLFMMTMTKTIFFKPNYCYQIL